MADRHGVASYPGIIGVIGASVTISHGITPSSITLNCQPQNSLPALSGPVTITDGVDTVVIPDCRFNQIKINADSGGFEWLVEIFDRRWKWRDFGVISGCYNQLDPHGKLIPWMIRSPQELAVLCLEAMGETGYQIDMPPGIDSSWGLNVNNFLSVGVNYPATGTNPPINWEAQVPAQALQNLAEHFGRHVVYDPIQDIVLIARPGVGADLPTGSLAAATPSLDVPETPDGIVVVGTPTRYQCRFELEAVGLEWDLSYKPIEALSYAPAQVGHVQISKWKLTFPANPDPNGYTVYIRLGCRGKDETYELTMNAISTPTTALTVIAADINSTTLPQIADHIKASVAGSTMTLTGKKEGVGFEIMDHGYSDPVPIADGFKSSARTTQPADDLGNRWIKSPPPLFPNIKATDRLTKVEAIALAQKSVFRCYRLTGRDASGTGPIFVPGFGPTQRKQQVVLLDTQVDQIVPSTGDTTYQDIFGVPIIVNHYYGYHKDKPAACYGQIASYLTSTLLAAGILNDSTTANTPFESQIMVGFEIDPIYQVVTFSNPVYKAKDGGGIEAAEPILQTACHVRDATANSFERYTQIEQLNPDGKNYHVAVRDDVQLEINCQYGPFNIPALVTVEDADPILRAKYYLDGLKEQYLLADALTLKYNGIVPISVDGAISQITWSVGDAGAETTASKNSEHAIWLPPYPARRRAENLQPAQLEKIKPPERVSPLPGGEGTKFQFW